MRSYPTVREAIAAAEESFVILDRKPNLPADGHLHPQHLESCVEFKNVSFSYSGKTDQSDLVLKVRTEMIPCVFSVLCLVVLETLILLPSSSLPGHVIQAKARYNNCPGGQEQLRQVHLCQTVGEILPASGRGHPTGWTTAERLQGPVPAREGDQEHDTRHICCLNHVCFTSHNTKMQNGKKAIWCFQPNSAGNTGVLMLTWMLQQINKTNLKIKTQQRNLSPNFLKKSTLTELKKKKQHCSIE